MAANKIMGNSLSKAVYNISRAALLTLALRVGKFDYLKIGTQDRLHQPARKALFPAVEELFQAALEAGGASGVFLSGSGSIIMALSRDESHAGEIAQAMEKAAGEENIGMRSKIVSFASREAEIISID